MFCLGLADFRGNLISGYITDHSVSSDDFARLLPSRDFIDGLLSLPIS